MAKSPKMIARLARAFPRHPITPETFELYVEELEGIAPEVLDQAVTNLVRSSEWFPTVSAIRNTCAEIVLALPTESAALAEIDARIDWGRVRAENPDGAPHEPPAVHPLVGQALERVGGFPALRTSEKPWAVRSQFCNVYGEIRAAAVREAQMNPALEAPRALLSGPNVIAPVYPAT